MVCSVAIQAQTNSQTIYPVSQVHFGICAKNSTNMLKVKAT